ncbi:MAG TPA: ATP synthase F1 subunit delta [Polyangia bacterium]|nr:ATP synthase F1 subunit delta [Polyangia bacterium]
MALEGSIARRYARALLEIGIEHKSYEKLGRELEVVSSLYRTSKDLQDTLSNPVFKLSQRKAVLEKLSVRLGLSKSVRHFLLLIMDRRRIGRLPDIAREMSALVDQQAGRVRATVVSARPLGEDFALTLRGAIEKRLGKKVILEKREDPALIGGMVTKVGDILYDGSVRTQLALAKQRLLSE